MRRSWDTENQPRLGSCTPRRSPADIAGRKCRSSAPDGDSTAQKPGARSPGRRPGSGTRGVFTRIDRHGFNDDWVDRTVTSPSAYLRDVVHHVTARLVRHLAEDRVSAVEMRRRANSDEELRTVGARTGVRHGQQVWLVEDQVGMELVAKLAARTTGARTDSTAALQNEAGDPPVKGQPVVELAGLCRA